MINIFNYCNLWKVRSFLKNVFIYKTHKLSTNTRLGSWVDADVAIENAISNALIDFFELECRDWFHWKKFVYFEKRDGEKGIEEFRDMYENSPKKSIEIVNKLISHYYFLKSYEVKREKLLSQFDLLALKDFNDNEKEIKKLNKQIIMFGKEKDQVIADIVKYRYYLWT